MVDQMVVEVQVRGNEMQTIFILYLALSAFVILGLLATAIRDWRQDNGKLAQLRKKLTRQVNLTIPGKLPIPQRSTMNVGLTRAKTDRQVQPE